MGTGTCETPRVRKGRILIVDDSAAMRSEVAAALLRSGEHEVADQCDNGFAALKAMTDLRPDIVVCDLHMPHCDGIQLLRLRAARPELIQIPFLMLTSMDDGEQKAELLELGAADYVTKPFHARELLARVRVHFKLRVAQEELKAANERLLELACTDALTGAFNRRHLDNVLEQEIPRHVRYGMPFSIALLDVDHFKRVNDQHGHATGDRVLTTIAATLKALVRRADVVCRYGGEEMCVVLPSTGAAGAMILSERLRAAIDESEHRDEKGNALRVTASVGIASAESRDPDLDGQRLIRRADRALYAAKSAGRNQVKVWSATWGDD